MTDTPKLTAEALRQFTGTETWYRHALVRHMLYTDGVLYLADAGGAHWLVDEIATGQLEPHVARTPFQSWRLRVHPNRSATLTCEDGNGVVVHTRNIEWTDFPLDEMHLFCTNNLILLPSEY